MVTIYRARFGNQGCTEVGIRILCHPCIDFNFLSVQHLWAHDVGGDDGVEGDHEGPMVSTASGSTDEGSPTLSHHDFF